MKIYLLLTCPLMLVLSYSSFSQEYSYTHYDVKDGLAGSNVYCITQDKQGFLWIGTDAGLSRFDGTHFKNFTLEDGLPDIEVLQIFADSRDRIWMGPFSKSICYYYQGKIHNQDNDPLLAKIRLRSNIHSFAEDPQGNIMIASSNALFLVTRDGKVTEYDSAGGQPMICSALTCGADGHFVFATNTAVFRVSDSGFLPILQVNLLTPSSLYITLNAHLMLWRSGGLTYSIMSLQSGKRVDFPFGMSLIHVSFGLIGDSLGYRNESMGTREYNFYTGVSRYFQLGAQVSRVFRDDEGNTWFTSLGQGIFRLNSDEFKSIKLMSPLSTRCVAKSIRKLGKDLLIGGNYNMLFRFSLPSFKDAGSYKVDASDRDEIRYVHPLKDNKLFVASSDRIFLCHFGGATEGERYITAKAAVPKNDSEVLVAGAYGVNTMDPTTLRVKDTLWKDRTTCINYIDGSVFIGTLNGLYVLNSSGTVSNWGEKDRVLRKRISAVERGDDGSVWIATYGEGIIAFKDGHKVAAFTRKQGLSSDLCRTLRPDHRVIWVGTDRGLNKVDLDNQDEPVTTYTANDGLGSDIVNIIFTDSSLVYVGTPEGLSFFDGSRVDRSSGCRLFLLSVIHSGTDRLADSAHLLLPYRDNNIRFEYAGISYRSSGNIWYHYRLLGLDSSWKKTKETFLEYPTLPSGDYELQVKAVNKFGTLSNTVSLHFVVATPFWRTVWFGAAMLVLFLFLTWLFVTLRIKYLRLRQAEQEELHKRLAETEHMALQSQMNPHFIFNCLNSIQQYIFDQDILAANKYITGFARLIRATLQNSSKPFISLTDEVDYLSAYLSLEKLRFKEKLNYSIDIAPSIRADMDDIHIPPMLIQPYVENSMRHGLRHRMGEEGFIRINILQEGDKLVIIVEDNGIGREQAARYKTREHIEYQSRGMSLTADRIRLINTAKGDNIRVEVVDLKNIDGKATGTRVIMRFPRYDLFLQNNDI